MLNVTAEIERLRNLRVSQLQEEYSLLTGEVARSNNRAFLIKRIAWRLQARALGGLSEQARLKAAELAREQDLRIRPRPEIHSAYAGAAGSGPGPDPHPREVAGAPSPGQWLVREYRGRRIEVKALDRGFEWNGTSYRSLSAVAKAVTGSDWNGRLFFGLTTRKERPSC